MNVNVGKEIRLHDIIDSRDSRSLLVDLTVASSIGAQKKLEDMGKVLSEINDITDGLILNPGQVQHNAGKLGGKNRATPIIRLDWSNIYRDEKFCLPAVGFERIAISDPEDALSLGASAVIVSFILGLSDDEEARSVESIAQVVRTCYGLNLPVIVDLKPIGKKVSSYNYDDALHLGISFMMEAGADAIIFPEIGEKSLNIIQNWITVPFLISSPNVPDLNTLDYYLDHGATGFVLHENIFRSDYKKIISEVHSFIHQKIEINVPIR